VAAKNIIGITHPAFGIYCLDPKPKALHPTHPVLVTPSWADSPGSVDQLAFEPTPSICAEGEYEVQTFKNSTSGPTSSGLVGFVIIMF
jgi:hypothetical protein